MYICSKKKKQFWFYVTSPLLHFFPVQYSVHLSVTTLMNKYYLQYLLTSSYIVPCSTILFDLLLYQLPIVQYCTVYILVVLLFPLYSVQLIPAVCLFTVPEVFKVPGEVLRLIVSTSSVVLPCVLHSTVTTPLQPAVLLCTSPALPAGLHCTLL